MRFVRELPGTVRFLHLWLLAVWSLSWRFHWIFTKCTGVALPELHGGWGTLLRIHRWSEEKEQFLTYGYISSKCICWHSSPPQRGISELELAMLFSGQRESRVAVGMLGHTCWLLENQKKTLPFRNKTQTVNTHIINTSQRTKAAGK